MSDIKKDVWEKRTKYKLFGFVIFEKDEICDSSMYEQEKKEKFIISPFRGLK